jgi:hypothetical protein
MQELIKQKLAEVEKSQHIRILYACESGSRGWGFPSIDSDYDVRFIYVHSQDWYFSIEERKDTIELPVNEVLDISGWDIRKALQQVRKSNPAVFEWMESPTVYQEQADFEARFASLMAHYFSPRVFIFHHLGLVKKMLVETKEGEAVKLKKCFYILRSLLSAMWVREKLAVPPMEFEPLKEMLPEGELLTLINEWQQQKAQATEKEVVQSPAIFDAFVAQQFRQCELFAQTAPVHREDTEPLNEFFRHIVTNG